MADIYNHRVQVFSAEGAFVRAFGSQGAAPGQLVSACGVAVSAVGEVFVVGRGNHRVNVFRASDGAFLRAFGSPGNRDGQLHACSTRTAWQCRLLATCRGRQPQPARVRVPRQ